ncbi:MAG TPA: adenine deaminase [Chitinophagaceae bacterium]|nr:adenine deaminase [Chitinophagaceae bacterium]
MEKFTVSGNLVDVHSRRIYPASVMVEGSRIASVTATGKTRDEYIMPGFIDSHVHVESSMLVPSEFARLAVVHGTVGTVSDPHEIANVLGLKGIEFMLDNGRQVPFKFCFGAPSCVPATVFETAGARIDADQVDSLLSRPDIGYLSEMMNFPGVLHGDEEVMLKLASARSHHKPVDGHAPGLRGVDAAKYIRGGKPEGEVIISTDHECFTREEAMDKLECGMKILIREGSAAKNFDALIGLLPDYPTRMMFCSDDKHPDSLVKGHINLLVKRALDLGLDLFSVLQAACINPVIHYGLDIGLVRRGDPADFIVVKDLKRMEVLATYIAGIPVASAGQTAIRSVPVVALNHFRCSLRRPEDFDLIAPGPDRDIQVNVIEALDGQLVTGAGLGTLKVFQDRVIEDPASDILRLSVVNRYQDAPPQVAFIRNFGLKRGAIASSVAHDSHNIIAVGTDTGSLCTAVNTIIEHKGGICIIDGERRWVLPLPIAGIMSGADGYAVAEKYTALDTAAKAMGSTLQAPFMTLSFMALLVIPHLKLSDQGLFDGDRFRLTRVIPPKS